MALIASICVINLVAGDADRIVAVIVIALLSLAWCTFGRRGFTRPTAAAAFLAILVVASGVMVFVDPSTAFVQAIACPLIWVMVDRVRVAVAVNALLTVVIAVAMATGLGSAPDDWTQAVLIEGISLVGSIALGVWITRLAELSEERQKLLDELTLAQVRLATLSRESGASGERERLAREIHDTIAQSLTGVVLLTQRLKRELAADTLDVAGDTAALLEESAREALTEARSLVASTSAVDLGGGVEPALRRLAGRFERETGIHVDLDVDRVEGLDRDVEVVLLRCAQEGLANVRKHSGAASARLGLIRAGAEVRLTVGDDGAGFDPARSSDGYGLAGMRARLGLADGRLEVRSAPGSGSTLVASLPLGSAS
ncbi:signal transduction histidine kinase [Frondihabitans sp. PhB188]|uniref:sensor histidine kinase n=1 Tax=Frondihabitans sp. PhB188 TaxID=2485200 RepID=UPI000F4A9254|nr:sensor histidine kinase [Frondihabitans sp. PhB188]ROQ36588.1 signal transduction histidine kinase [Frondihabitans sp. PhB188]